jgi:uncharacterized protein (TIGR02996 family)
MSEQDALLAAVFAAPDDDLPRLVYADWLEEHGESDHAEFIRLQIRRSGMAGDDPTAKEIDGRIVLLRAVGADRWLGPIKAAIGALAGAVHATFRRGFASELSVVMDGRNGSLAGPLGRTLYLARSRLRPVPAPGS